MPPFVNFPCSCSSLLLSDIVDDDVNRDPACLIRIEEPSFSRSFCSSCDCCCCLAIIITIVEESTETLEHELFKVFCLACNESVLAVYSKKSNLRHRLSVSPTTYDHEGAAGVCLQFLFASWSLNTDGCQSELFAVNISDVGKPGVTHRLEMFEMKCWRGTLGLTRKVATVPSKHSKPPKQPVSWPVTLLPYRWFFLRALSLLPCQVTWQLSSSPLGLSLSSLPHGLKPASFQVRSTLASCCLDANTKGFWIGSWVVKRFGGGRSMESLIRSISLTINCFKQLTMIICYS